MEFMPVFGALSSVLGMFGGKEDKPDPAPQVEERPVAGQAEDVPQTAGAKERAAVRNSRKDSGISGSSLSTRSGVSIVGGQ